MGLLVSDMNTIDLLISDLATMGLLISDHTTMAHNGPIPNARCRLGGAAAAGTTIAPCHNGPQYTDVATKWSVSFASDVVHSNKASGRCRPHGSMDRMTIPGTYSGVMNIIIIIAMCSLHPALKRMCLIQCMECIYALLNLALD